MSNPFLFSLSVHLLRERKKKLILEGYYPIIKACFLFSRHSCCCLPYWPVYYIPLLIFYAADAVDGVRSSEKDADDDSRAFFMCSLRGIKGIGETSLLMLLLFLFLL